jgi:cytochrome c biogenesis protein CcmG, thiol:disulfide interchange protein DsbE
VNRFAWPLVVFALLVVMFGVALKRAPEKQVLKSVLIGKPAPEFVLPNLLQADQPVRSSDFKGRWTVVNVWGTWCAECRAEHETLLQIRQEGKVLMVGLNYKDEDGAARDWVAQLGNPYDVIAVDHEGRAAIDWGVYGAPETFLIDPKGVIVHKYIAALTPEIWRTQFLPLIDKSFPGVNP